MKVSCSFRLAVNIANFQSTVLSKLKAVDDFRAPLLFAPSFPLKSAKLQLIK
jgi:hypothetical protein